MGNANIIGVLEGAASPCLAVDQTRCAKVRNRNVNCLKCADACTSGCIALMDGELRVDASKCVGCGTCATVCPTCALEARNPTDAELLARCRGHVRNGVVAIACGLELEALDGLVDRDAIVSVVCAGRVDESLLVQLAADGCSEVHVLCGVCEQCAQRAGRKTTELVMENAKAILDAWGSACDVTTRFPQQLLLEGASIADVRAAEEASFSSLRANPPVIPLPPEPALRHRDAGNSPCAGMEDECGVPRAATDAGSKSACPAPDPRDSHDGGGAVAKGGLDPAAVDVNPSRLTGEELEEALGTFFKKRVKVKTQPSLVKVMKDGTLPHFLPDRRERLLNALVQLGEPKAASLETRLWGCVVIDGTKCSSCQMCATFCPTGAISKYLDEDGSFGVTHYPGDCVKCASCVDICKEGAVRIVDSVPPAYLLDGTVHRYVMRPRSVELGPHQMKDTMQQYMDIPIYER